MASVSSSDAPDAISFASASAAAPFSRIAADPALASRVSARASLAPAARAASHTRRSVSSRRLERINLAPMDPRCTARVSPRPCDAPVIHTTFPSYADLGASPSAAEARSHSPNAALPSVHDDHDRAQLGQHRGSERGGEHDERDERVGRHIERQRQRGALPHRASAEKCGCSLLARAFFVCLKP